MKKLGLIFLGSVLFLGDAFAVSHNGGKKVASMAIIKMSGIGITAMSGKFGGTIASRNRGGAYIKNFVMPVNTFSDARQAARAAFGAISSAWRSLTQVQRNSFIEQASAYPVINALGDTKTLSGSGLYVQLNRNLQNAGLPGITTAIAPEGTNGVIADDGPTVFDVGAGDELTLQFDLESSNATAENDYVLEATPGVSQSIRNVDNKFRVFRSTAATYGTTPVGATLGTSAFAASGAALLAAYNAQFGEPEVGNIVYFRVKPINPRTGEAGAYWTFRAVVSAS